MSERMTVTRRTLMNTAAAAGAAGVLGGIAQAQAPTTSLPVPGVTEVTADRRYGMSRRHDCAPPLPAALVDQSSFYSSTLRQAQAVSQITAASSKGTIRIIGCPVPLNE
jgi:hypothetical protein